MLKMSIRSKLFLTLLVAAGLVVVGMFALIQWSFDRGFLNYVNALEQQRLDSLVSTLEAVYSEKGGLNWLEDNRRIWWRLLRENAFENLSETERAELQQRFEKWRTENPDRRPRFPSAPPADGAPRGLRFENRVILLDADKEPVVGPRDYPAGIEFRPLTHDGATVGFIGLVPQASLTGSLQQRFAQEQKKAFALISFGVVFVAGLLSLPLARTMIRRIDALAVGTHQLSSGHYATRVKDSGSDELSQLARDFNLLARTLEQNEQARKQWIVDISHELRTPLAVLRGEIEALQDGVRAASPAALNSLHDEVLQLTRLIEDLYQLSLSDLGGLSYRKAALDPVALLGNTLAAYRSLLADRQLTLSEKLPDVGKLSLHGDAERLRQLFENLLENSLRYTDVGGALEVALTELGTEIEVVFRDSAPGVDEADLPRLFERLYRVESSRNRASGGAGLGLSICRNIIEAHGGSINATASALGGVQLTLRLPKGGQ
jgi:two-component system, OmpR family, sensor histidine kinase BaeS